jgi:hypothetical protein
MTSTAAVPAEILAAIVADAAGDEVPARAVEVVSAESVRWNDGSLGCPEPGRSYTQALVDGYRVIVRVGDLELDYRVNGRGRFRICRRGGGRSGRSFR